LDWGPKAIAPGDVNMTAMEKPMDKALASAPRRFLLLPEESVERASHARRIRRYKLISIGQRPAVTGAGLATGRLAGELGRLGRM
jgi:hypothetical protein